MVDPIIKYQTCRFCKKYCNDQYFNYQCTLPVHAYSAPKRQSLLCEWGNASYGWMLDDLTKTSRLEKFAGETEKQLGNYFFTIANSLAFYERWKNWRFGRRKNVPLYIQSLSPDASKVFFCLCNREQIPIIAQKMNKTEVYITNIVDKILNTLTKKGKLSLLQHPSEVLLSSIHGNSDDSEPVQADLPFIKNEPSNQAFRLEIQQVFAKLDATEKFVVESMVIDDCTAKQVLEALKSSNISLKPNLAAKDMNQQHVFYFLRKTLNKLKVKVMNS